MATFTEKFEKMFTESKEAKLQEFLDGLKWQTLIQAIAEKVDSLPFQTVIVNEMPYLFWRVGIIKSTAFFIHNGKLYEGTSFNMIPSVKEIGFSEENIGNILCLMDSHDTAHWTGKIICPEGYYVFRFITNYSVSGYDVPDEKRTIVIKSGTLEKALTSFAKLITVAYRRAACVFKFQIWQGGVWQDIKPLINDGQYQLLQPDTIWPSSHLGMKKELSFQL